MFTKIFLLNSFCYKITYSFFIAHMIFDLQDLYTMFDITVLGVEHYAIMYMWLMQTEIQI